MTAQPGQRLAHDAAVRSVPGWAWVAGVLALALLAVGPRYGFHRDELYFVEAGRHPALGYPDQPALVPLLATAWYDLVGGSLRWFRLLPAVSGALVVAVAALTCRELGGDRRSQTWTAVLVATSTTVMVVAHLFGTTVVDVLLTSLLILLLVRAVRTGSPGVWLGVGLVAAVALTVKTLPATVLACAVLALALVGPRAPFRSPWAWLAALIAAAGLLPSALWQQANGWPQGELAASIAAGGSGTSVERALFLPMLLTLTGPGTAAVLVVGAVALWRRPGLRWVTLTAGLLGVAVLAGGGKPYYLLGVVPVLVAAGVPVCRRWADGRTARSRLLVGLVVVNAVVGSFLALPLLPAALAPVAVVYDHGEQVGWPELVATVAEAAAGSGADAVLTQNYGQAGALDQAADRGLVLPPVHSGHNGYWWWGPPAPDARVVVAVGWEDDTALTGWFAGCEQVGTVRNDAGVDNEEAGTPVRVCTVPRASWEEIWPEVQRLR